MFLVCVFFFLVQEITFPQRFICFAICLTDTRSLPDSLAHMESSAVQECKAVTHTCFDAQMYVLGNG